VIDGLSSTMQVSQSTLLLGAAVIAAAFFALGRETAPAPETMHVVEGPPQAPPEQAGGVEDPMQALQDPHAGKGGSLDPVPDTEPAAMTWTVPPTWHTMPNPSSMRIATYSVPRAAGDAADAEVSVTRAGGDIASNIDRWVGQFASAGDPKQTSRTVKGLAVTTVEIEGTYTNGMDPSAKPKAGWALLAAIVKTPGQPYFFKMTGPAATVHAAKAALTAMIDGIQPAAKGSAL
jgi:hypothetical protein